MKIIPYGKQHITEEDKIAVLKALDDPYLTQGPKVAEFEKKFSAYVGAKYAIAVSNGTAALHLAAVALGVAKKTRVITTPITFAATANCISYCGGEVTLVDIDPKTVTLDLNKVEELLASVPIGTYQGIIPVSFAGYPVDLEKFRILANKYNLWIIEDACHAIGGWFSDSNDIKQYCGNSNYADLSIFSFHPVKHIACGEGGMITTNNQALAQKLRMLRTHGITKDKEKLEKYPGGWYYEMQMLGFNYRMPDLLCALGVSQLERANQGLARRKIIAARYDEAFRDLALQKIVPSEDIGHAYHLYVIQIENRKKVYDFLRRENIFPQVHYIPIHYLPYYQNRIQIFKELTNAESYYENCLSLPMYPSLSDDEQSYVIQKIKEVL